MTKHTDTHTQQASHMSEHRGDGKGNIVSEGEGARIIEGAHLGLTLRTKFRERMGTRDRTMGKVKVTMEGMEMGRTTTSMRTRG